MKICFQKLIQAFKKKSRVHQKEVGFNVKELEAFFDYIYSAEGETVLPHIRNIFLQKIIFNNRRYKNLFDENFESRVVNERKKVNRLLADCLTMIALQLRQSLWMNSIELEAKAFERMDFYLRLPEFRSKELTELYLLVKKTLTGGATPSRKLEMSKKLYEFNRKNGYLSTERSEDLRHFLTLQDLDSMTKLMLAGAFAEAHPSRTAALNAFQVSTEDFIRFDSEMMRAFVSIIDKVTNPDFLKDKIYPFDNAVYCANLRLILWGKNYKLEHRLSIWNWLALDINIGFFSDEMHSLLIEVLEKFNLPQAKTDIESILGLAEFSMRPWSSLSSDGSRAIKLLSSLSELTPEQKNYTTKITLPALILRHANKHPQEKGKVDSILKKSV